MSKKDLDLTKLEGVEVTVKLQHANDDKTNQYISIENNAELADLHLSGWIGSYLGKEKTSVKKTIKEAFLVQHNNGVRSNSHRAKTYKEYWNNEMKQKVMAARSAGVLGQLMGSSGDNDRADIIVYFEDGSKLDSFAWIEAPEEWYSEQYSATLLKYLKRGFYDTAKDAIKDQDTSDDMFGERYFPVAAFPVGIPQDKIDACVWQPKAVSEPILAGGYKIYGSRCKPHEVEDFISSVYSEGGRIIKHTEWDWQP